MNKHEFKCAFLFVLLCSFAFSGIMVNADNNAYFSGVTISGSDVLTTSNYLKQNYGTQDLYVTNSKGTLTWFNATIKATLYAENGTASMPGTGTTGDTIYFDKQSLKNSGVYYYMKLERNNSYTTGIYFSGIWHIN